MNIDININGRNRYNDTAKTVIEIRNTYGNRRPTGEPFMTILGGYVEKQGNDDYTFRVQAKHLTAVDEENDSSYVVSLDCAGFQFDSQNLTDGGYSFFGVLLNGKWYKEQPADDAEELPFMPPEQNLKPQICYFTVTPV